MSFSMSKSEREAFLAETRVGRSNNAHASAIIAFLNTFPFSLVDALQTEPCAMRGVAGAAPTTFRPRISQRAGVLPITYQLCLRLFQSPV